MRRQLAAAIAGLVMLSAVSKKSPLPRASLVAHRLMLTATALLFIRLL
jgi:hypothetical protein